MSVYVAPNLPQPQAGVPYTGSIAAEVQGGATGSIVFDVYAGGTGPTTPNPVSATQTLVMRSRASDSIGQSDTRGAARIVLVVYAETGAPTPPYNSGFGQLSVTGQSTVYQPVPMDGLDTFSLNATVAGHAIVTSTLTDTASFASSLLVPVPPSVLSDAFSTNAAQAALLTYLLAASDTMQFGSELTPYWIQVLLDYFGVTDLPVASYNSIVTLSDASTFNDLAALIAKMLRADSVSLSDAPASWGVIGAQLLDVLGVSSILGASYNAYLSLALGFVLGSTLADAQASGITSALYLDDLLMGSARALVALLDTMQASASMSASATLYGLLADSMTFADAPNQYAAIVQALIDGAQFGLTLYTGQDQYVAWVMTAPTRAMRRYINYPFNSFGELGGRLCGANASGLYWLDGDTDAGVEIPSMIRSGLMDFGSRQLKRMDRAYLGYTSNGTLGLNVITTSETGDKIAYTYVMVQKPANAPRESRVQIGRGMRSVYWQFELVNEAGSDFELHDLTLLPLVLSRRVT